ncbi:MAG: DUF3078 domain-containing protein [Cyclobacteriaceae bacterium]
MFGNFYPEAWAQADTTATEKEESFWETGGEFSATFQQVSLSNWAGGGQSTLALGGVVSFFWSYDDTVSRRWENSLEISYGIARVGKSDARFTKTRDNIIYTSRYGRKLSRHLYLSALTDFRSQIAQGFNIIQLNDSISDDVLTSEFMAPGFLVTSLGLTYSPAERKLTDQNIKPGKKEGNYFALTLSPFSGKFTFVLNDRLAESDQYNTDGKNVRAEAGSSLTIGFRRKVLENVVFTSNVNLFSNYEKMQNIDVNLESFLVLRVSKYIVSNVSLQMIYDDDIDVRRDDGSRGPALQVQSAINVGFAYGF